MKLDNLCADSVEVVRRAGNFIRAQMGKVGEAAVEEKSRNSLVSFVDREAEKILVDGLGDLLPKATFITEEDTVTNQDSPLQWIIDPLDGTTNFLYQLPCFSVSVGLRQEGRLVLGIVYEIMRDECFYGHDGVAPRLNSREIRVSRRTGIDQSLLATGFPYYDYSRMGPYFEVLKGFMRDSRGIRRMGSAAVDLAYVACGRFDAFFEYSLNPWDVAGGAYLVKAAGGLLSDFSGGDDYLFGGEVIAASPEVFPEVQNRLRQAFHPDHAE